MNRARRARRDLRLRAAQPVALLVRPPTGDLTIGDVGQDEFEEIDFVRQRGQGANFGWRPFEGRGALLPGESAPGAIAPVIERSHADGYCSITGGFVVRDPALPALYGRYVFGDYCRGAVLSARLRAGRRSDVRSTGLEGRRAVVVRRGRAQAACTRRRSTVRSTGSRRADRG